MKWFWEKKEDNFNNKLDRAEQEAIKKVYKNYSKKRWRYSGCLGYNGCDFEVEEIKKRYDEWRIENGILPKWTPPIPK